MDAANTSVDWLMRNLYDRGEGVRYAVEQTAGYTLPRIYQQWNRTRPVTGVGNPMAAMEMGIREFAADFADTFLPGLLATLLIAPLLDKKYQTLIRKNMGSQALTFYEALLSKPTDGTPTAQKDHIKTHRSQDEFFDAIGRCLTDYARRQARPDARIPDVSLAKHMSALTDKKRIPALIQHLVSELHLPHPDVTLSHTAPSPTSPTGVTHSLDISLPDLLRDLYELKVAPGFQNETLRSGIRQVDAPAAWGRKMADTLSRTRKLMPHQLWGILVALTASSSIPFITRLITRHYYGHDAFPGTKELHDHFLQKGTSSSQSAALQQTPKPQASWQQPGFQQEEPDDRTPKQKFVWFPYLKECVNKGQWLQPLLAGTFFAVLGGAVVRRFRLQNLSPLQPSHWLKVYEFSRGFPFTTVTQMELTYGLLCGTRLLSSRDDSEFRETGIRDCLMGWPTLTYGFDFMKKVLGTSFNKRLGQAFGDKTLPLLMKTQHDVRNGEEIAEHFFQNLDIPTGKIPEALQKSRLAHRWVTFASAVTNWVLLAFAEPQVGIWITNRVELNKLKQNNQAENTSAPSLAPSPSFPMPVGAHPIDITGQAGITPSEHRPFTTPNLPSPPLPFSTSSLSTRSPASAASGVRPAPGLTGPPDWPGKTGGRTDPWNGGIRPAFLPSGSLPHATESGDPSG